MTFRRRIALLAGLSFVAAVLACSVVGYVVVRNELLARIDADLRERVAVAPLEQPELRGLDEGPDDRRPRPDRPVRRPTDVLVQVVSAQGEVSVPATQVDRLPVDPADLALADAPPGRTVLRDVDVDGERYRLVSASTGREVAVQLARPLAEVDETLGRFAAALVVVSVTGALLAAAVGWGVARRSARPVVELTAAAEHVAATGEFDVRLTPRHDDEIGRLTASIAAMLAGLQEAREAQQRLVVDASHELRTPLTSLRTNIGMLDHPGLDEAARAEVVGDLRAEIDELSALAAELVDLATDRRSQGEPGPVDLWSVSQRVAARAARRDGDHEVHVHGAPSFVVGHEALLERVVQNLVDNALKWSPPGAAVDVEVGSGELTVRDRGPGVPPAERALVFERFYRTDAARATPGSGLGLAIVRQIVTDHGGTVVMEEAPGGGALVRVHLPATDVARPPDP